MKSCCAKGQLISKFPFGFIVWTKIPTKNLTNLIMRLPKHFSEAKTAKNNISSDPTSFLETVLFRETVHYLVTGQF